MRIEDKKAMGSCFHFRLYHDSAPACLWPQELRLIRQKPQPQNFSKAILFSGYPESKFL